MIRPSYFTPATKEDHETRTLKENTILRYMMGALATVIPAIGIQPQQLGKAALEIAKGKYDGQAIFENAQLKDIGGSD